MWLLFNMDYDWTCTAPNVVEINGEEFETLMQDPSVTIIDVREKGELPVITDVSAPANSIIDNCSRQCLQLQAIQLLLFANPVNGASRLQPYCCILLVHSKKFIA